jgi:hypothetical protein
MTWEKRGAVMKVMNTTTTLAKQADKPGLAASAAEPTVEALVAQDYKWGFVTDIEAETVPRGLNEDIIRLISAKKHEPDWMLEWRLKAYRHWVTLEQSAAEPLLITVVYSPIVTIENSPL